MFFLGAKFKKRIHLRHIYRVAIMVEDEGIRVYKALADAPVNENVKNLCAQLLADEQSHKKLFQAALSRWKALPEGKEDALDELVRKLQDTGLFSPLPCAEAREKDILNFALELEHKTAEFYQSFEKNFPQVWKKMQIAQLVVAEKAHANKLKVLFKDFEGGWK